MGGSTLQQPLKAFLPSLLQTSLCHLPLMYSAFDPTQRGQQ